ncbi:hypothetical protein A6E15_05265 [Natrinema saccharevitans]|uniref:Uncharacterized protein n=1 Tax=Natrinema saccharevitans TaxID=301967 RepID=A0A1S8AV41_9EURY|nr:hypothetical protein [Natrinema saccharevitans]OLZ40431.1 hypothetical protein A6E15_05265 [Natrinema saccharevitans]
MSRRKLLVAVATAVVGAVTLVESGRFASIARRADGSEQADTEPTVPRDGTSGERRFGRRVSASLDPIFRQP